MKRISFLDSHTGGEPTRLIVNASFLDLGPGSVADKLFRLKTNHDTFRSGILNEPRGSDVLVGALLVPPSDSSCQYGVIFFNNVGYLGMCGHGTIGLVTTLAYLGRLGPGRHVIETPVGDVTVELHASGTVSVRNIPAYRHAHAVAVDVPGHGRLTGDVAWGGNWFFLCADHGQALEFGRVEALVDFSWRVRQALVAAGITGASGAEIDHIELTGPGSRAGLDGRNFVLCPGKAYDRSPCGTGTSAKLACLVADGKFGPGRRWRQEGIVGSVFEGRVELEQGAIIPTITGQAWVTADATLLLDPKDPYCNGIGSAA